MTMPRRQELEEKAKAIVDEMAFRPFYPLQHEIQKALFKVERECWAANEKAARDTAFLMGNDMWRERKALNDHADWCRAQKEGVTHV